jgi:hypothetical protein
MPTATTDFFQGKNTSSVAFLAGILLFFLPFVQIRCNNMPFAENTGLGLAFGTDYKVTGQLNGLQEGFGNDHTAAKSPGEKGKLYVAALLALALGVAGLFVSLSNHSLRTTTGMICGGLAALLLIIVMVQINSDVKTESKAPDDHFTETVQVTVDYTFWFYLSIVSFLAAAFLSYKQKQSIGSTHEPAKTETTVAGHEPLQ